MSAAGKIIQDLAALDERLGHVERTRGLSVLEDVALAQARYLGAIAIALADIAERLQPGHLIANVHVVESPGQGVAR